MSIFNEPLIWIIGISVIVASFVFVFIPPIVRFIDNRKEKKRLRKREDLKFLIITEVAKETAHIRDDLFQKMRDSIMKSQPVTSTAKSKLKLTINYYVGNHVEIHADYFEGGANIPTFSGTLSHVLHQLRNNHLSGFNVETEILDFLPEKPRKINAS